MPHRAVLTPADDFFGRVALFNNLITLDQIVECARAIGAEMVAGRPRRSLATTLIVKGYLSAKAAGAVEEAIRRQHAKQAGGGAPPAAAPTPKPPPMADHAPSGHSQIVVTLDDDAFVEAPQSEDRLRKVVTRICPGLIYPEMLTYIVRHRLSIVDGRQLATAIGEPETDVFAALHHWQSIGLLKKVGTHPYCWGPTPQEEQDVKFLMDAWTDPRRHARVLGFILAAQT